MPKTTTNPTIETTTETTTESADERLAYRVLTVLDYGTDATDQRRYQPGETVKMRAIDVPVALALGAIEPLPAAE